MDYDDGMPKTFTYEYLLEKSKRQENINAISETLKKDKNMSLRKLKEKSNKIIDPGEIILSFGKHKGRKINETPILYIMYLLKKMDEKDFNSKLMDKYHVIFRNYIKEKIANLKYVGKLNEKYITIAKLIDYTESSNEIHGNIYKYRYTFLTSSDNYVYGMADDKILSDKTSIKKYKLVFKVLEHVIYMGVPFTKIELLRIELAP